MANEIPGYHFAQTSDGAFAIEQDVPCDGVVTLTWKPQDYPGAPATIELPATLFLPAIGSYVKERNEARKAREKAPPVPPVDPPPQVTPPPEPEEPEGDDTEETDGGDE